MNLGHHVITDTDLTQDECLHITAARSIVEQIDTVHEISPSIDFTGKSNQNSTKMIACH